MIEIHAQGHGREFRVPCNGTFEDARREADRMLDRNEAEVVAIVQRVMEASRSDKDGHGYVWRAAE